MQDKDVKIKMSICPKCGNAIRVAVEHTMTNKSKKQFALEVIEYDLQVITISLIDYQNSNILIGCNKNCENNLNK